MAKKKKGFLENVARVVTGKTAEQRMEEAKEKRKLQLLEQQAYFKEKERQAPIIGQQKAKIQARARIKALSQPKTQSSTGLFGGKPQAGFDPLTFGSSSGAFGSKAKQSKTPSPMSIANMHFTDYTKSPSPAKAKVKRKLKRKRRKK